MLSCKRMSCRSNLPRPDLLADTGKHGVCKLRQSGIFFCALHRGAILLLTSLKMSRRLIGSLLSSGVPGLTEFNGCLPFFGKQLACDCGRSLCHAEMLEELVRELACILVSAMIISYISLTYRVFR